MDLRAVLAPVHDVDCGTSEHPRRGPDTSDYPIPIRIAPVSYPTTVEKQRQMIF